ncbi:hypothetical protein RFI_00066 [Reticulomyxa filosa]|uniref:Uncharacterized protein n=1 Tax=Reticulomyxa filosa TaxID=46433 RepID=X6PH31_RETFI|nr:hypothetical protein RFI_00066 [Reticulomyxa filosa]|eukprot:ETO36997.1 hypothetical protein RFI_00066 [Reticulomyxa filosa]
MTSSDYFQRLQKDFKNLDKEIIFQVWTWRKKDVDETVEILNFISKNSTSPEQQKILMQLLQIFGDCLSKEQILESWNASDRAFGDTTGKLVEMSFVMDINEIEEENDLKITREICLDVLWNLLNFPTKTKYRQIDNNALLRNLQDKCQKLNENIDDILADMTIYLQKIGFDKGNDGNWYFQNMNVEKLWKCYQSVINDQLMYCTVFQLFICICK